MKTLLIFAVLVGFSSNAGANSPCLSDPPVLRELVKLYSERTGTKFVLDPRVRARVQLFGVSPEEIEFTTLEGIFSIHGFSAFESQGVIYVVPSVAAGDLQKLIESNTGR